MSARQLDNINLNTVIQRMVSGDLMATTDKLFNFSQTITDVTDANVFPFLSITKSINNIAPSADSTGLISGFDYEVLIPDTNTHDVGTISGMYSFLEFKGTGAANALFAGAAQIDNYYNGLMGQMDAFDMILQHFGGNDPMNPSGTVDIATVAYMNLNAYDGSGVISFCNLAQYYVYLEGSASIGTNCHIYINSPTGVGKINSNFGIYIEDQSGAAVSSHAIYAAGGNSYHAGRIGIGIEPTAALHISGVIGGGTYSFKSDAGKTSLHDHIEFLQGSALTNSAWSVGVDNFANLCLNAPNGTGINLSINGVNTIASRQASPCTITQAAGTTGTTVDLFRATGAAHTNLTASTERTAVTFDLAQSVQFATGALTTQRAFRVTAPTYAFVGASTLTTAATLAISGAPVAGTNATITSSLALWIESGISRFDGLIDISNIAAGSPNLKITATSDTPSVTWTAHVPSADPAGYMEINVGGNSRYIPFWA